MQDHGLFTLYEPPVRASSAAYLKNAAGTDFYALCHVLKDTPGAFVLVDPATGRVVGAGARGDLVFPLGLKLVFVAGADPGAFAGLMLANGAFIPAPPLPAPTITRAQCAAELAARGCIDEDEAVALAATGALPQALKDHLACASLDTRIRLRAACAAAVLERSNAALREGLAALGQDPDTLFTAAAARQEP